VLTAAHCVCQKDKGMDCCIRPHHKKPNIEARYVCYNVTRFFRVTIGDNSNHPAPEHQFRVKRAIVHYMYRDIEDVHHSEYKRNGRDIALLELDRPISPNSQLMPVCLPPGREFPDDHGHSKGYSEGWGTDTDKENQCMTGEEGPSPFARCQVRTRVNKGDGKEPRGFNGCNTGKSPTAMLVRREREGLCARLKNYLKQKKMIEKHFIIRVLRK